MDSCNNTIINPMLTAETNCDWR